MFHVYCVCVCVCVCVCFIFTASNMNSTTCRKDFYRDKFGYCKPHCGRWKAYPQMTQTVSDAFIILSAAGGIIAAIIVITLAYLRHKTV